jgi:hypothetical protein
MEMIKSRSDVEAMVQGNKDEPQETVLKVCFGMRRMKREREREREMKNKNREAMQKRQKLFQLNETTQRLSFALIKLFVYSFFPLFLDSPLAQANWLADFRKLKEFWTDAEKREFEVADKKSKEKSVFAKDAIENRMQTGNERLFVLFISCFLFLSFLSLSLSLISHLFLSIHSVKSGERKDSEREGSGSGLRMSLVKAKRSVSSSIHQTVVDEQKKK